MIHSVFPIPQFSCFGSDAQKAQTPPVFFPHKKQGQDIDMQLYRSLFFIPATGCHFKGPIALRHSFSTALPIILFVKRTFAIRFATCS